MQPSARTSKIRSALCQLCFAKPSFLSHDKLHGFLTKRSAPPWVFTMRVPCPLIGFLLAFLYVEQFGRMLKELQSFRRNIRQVESLQQVEGYETAKGCARPGNPQVPNPEQQE